MTLFDLGFLAYLGVIFLLTTLLGATPKRSREALEATATAAPPLPSTRDLRKLTGEQLVRDISFARELHRQSMEDGDSQLARSAYELDVALCAELDRRVGANRLV
jgi:hypothetical protein